MTTDKLWTRGVLALGMVLMLLPFTVRVFADQPLVPGLESYGHLRIAETIASEGLLENDPALPDRPLPWNAFHVMLAGFIRILGSGLAGMLVPFALGLATLWLLLVACRQWRLPQPISRGAQVVFVLSPLFVDAFSRVSPRGLELFLLVLFLVVVAPGERSRLAQAVRIAIALLVAAIGASFGIIPALVYSILPLLARSVRRIPVLMIGTSVIAFIMLITTALPSYLQEESPAFGQQLPIVRVVSDFGAPAGLSLFAWLMAMVGLVLLWHLKKRYYAAMIMTSLALALGLFTPAALVASHVIVAFLAGYALASFAKAHWLFDDIKVLTLFVLVCGILFSTLAHAADIAGGPPDRQFFQAALAAKDALPQDAVILSLPDDGFAMAYWTGRHVYLDGWTRSIPRVNERWDVAQSVWHAQEISDLRPVLKRNRIDALIITDEMRKGKVWDLPEQDLLFLLRNSETFKNVHRSESVDIWAVHQPGQ